MYISAQKNMFNHELERTEWERETLLQSFYLYEKGKTYQTDNVSDEITPNLANAQKLFLRQRKVVMFVGIRLRRKGQTHGWLNKLDKIRRKSDSI